MACSPAADINALNNYDALSALPVFFGTDPTTGDGTGVFNGGGIDALAGYDALSAIPPYIALAGGDITATGDLRSRERVDHVLRTRLANRTVRLRRRLCSPAAAVDALAPNSDGEAAMRRLSAPAGLLRNERQCSVRSGCVHRWWYRRARRTTTR